MTQNIDFEPEVLDIAKFDATAAMDDKRVAQILTTYNSLRSYESDYDKAQGLLRTIASAWLLAGIGGCGYLVNAEITTQGWDHAAAGAARQAVILAVALGVGALWHLDQKIYQRLLHTVSALGYWIEYRFAFVPPTRMTLYYVNGDITSDLGRFYSMPATVILVAGVVNFAALLGNLANAAHRTPASAGISWQAFFAMALLMLLAHFAYWMKQNREAQKWADHYRNLLPQAAASARFDKGDAFPDRNR